MNKISGEIINSLDKSGMFQKILEFPTQLRQGWNIGKEARVKISLGQFNNIVFGGMGGSAIAGDLVRSIFGEELTIPVIVNRGYHLPGFVDSRTLFIASSYSGNTEETLTAAAEAGERGCFICCVTSGGQLARIAQEKGCQLFRLPPGYPPRGALGYSLGVFFSFFRELGVGKIYKDDVEKTISFLEDVRKPWQEFDNPDNLPFSLAKEISGKLPLIYSSVEGVDAVGFRWKTQFNENSKTHAFYQAFSEMNHNEIMGWSSIPGTKPFFPHLIMVLLRLSRDYSRIGLRMNITKNLVERNGGKVLEIEGKGESFFTQLLYLIHLGDLLSFYLAIFYNVDPTEIENINYLKKKLAESS